MKTFSTASEGPRYSYRHHPLHAQSYQILKKKEPREDPVPVGEYTVLDQDESAQLSERKVINLIALLNGRPQSLLDIGADITTRLVYQRVPSDDGKERIVFRTLGFEGVSSENALLTFLEEGVL